MMLMVSHFGNAVVKTLEDRGGWCTLTGYKNVNRKVQEEPQAEAAANLRQQEEEKKKKKKKKT